jgi:RimJ/RimL family protein N-acetyltransferase
MLKGNIVDLVLVERGDLQTVHDWFNDPDFVGEFEPFRQENLALLEKQFDGKSEATWFFIQKKDGTKIGYIEPFKVGDNYGIGYTLVPSERAKGYGSEAIQIMVDYLFLHKNIVRIQAETHPENIASQRVLEKAGFRKEGIIRKSFFSRGVWRDTAMFSVLREEWVAPKVLPIGHA